VMKKALLITLALLFLTGCYIYVSKVLTTSHIIKLPTFSSAYQIQENDFFPKPKDVSKVINIFYKHWVAEFGDKDYKIYGTLNTIMIEWREEPKRGGGFSLTGRSLKGVIEGVVVAPGYVWVWKGKKNKISSTALIHELIHCAIWSNSTHPDPDHEGDEFKGWTRKHTDFLYKINYLLEDMGM
jgi:hypothetical protein